MYAHVCVSFVLRLCGNGLCLNKIFRLVCYRVFGVA